MNLNDRVLASVTEKAAREGLRPSVYLCDAGLGTWLSRKVNAAANHALSRIGDNVNQ